MDKTTEYCNYILDFYNFIKPKARGFTLQRKLKHFNTISASFSLKEKIDLLKLRFNEVNLYKQKININYELKSYEDFLISQRNKKINLILESIK